MPTLPDVIPRHPMINWDLLKIRRFEDHPTNSKVTKGLPKDSSIIWYFQKYFRTFIIDRFANWLLVAFARLHAKSCDILVIRLFLSEISISKMTKLFIYLFIQVSWQHNNGSYNRSKAQKIASEYCPEFQ